MGVLKGVSAFVCVAAFLVAKIDSRPAANELPHIIFIVADDLGWADVEWRDPMMHTPTLNHMALNGVILNSSYVQPLCSPSRSAFMSGYFPFHTGLQHLVILPAQKVGLPANLTTLPDELKKRGYATHAVGKWHLGFCNWKYTPTFRGFDSFMGYYNAAEDYYTHVVGKGLDFRKNKDVDREDSGIYSTYLYTERTKSIVSAHNKSQPLFLYLPFQSVHEPLEVPSWYEDMYCKNTKNGTRKTKCGMVAILDEAIGNITQTLEAEGYMDNALVIFTTDNGGPVWAAGYNYPLRGAKSTMWEGGTRGTGFVYSKNLLTNRAGTVYDGMMHAVDWLPTIMSLVGGDTPPGIDGVSQWDSILTGAPSPRTQFVYNMDSLPLFHAAIRDGDWKLIQGSPGGYNGWYPIPGDDDAADDGTLMNEAVNQADIDMYQLYNIKDDPTEHNDVKDKFPDVLATMKARMEQWRQGMVPANFPPFSSGSNPANYDGVYSPGWCDV
ncbi:arylsulfatase B-like [Littorina saxatilis]|uniref:Sulfatase N-terminal domain-containing protein n=1 Tax=Littorina saxatilis TaxID=31220 RepID=A0AAN9B4K5_9CAEN